MPHCFKTLFPRLSANLPITLYVLTMIQASELVITKNY